MGKFLVGINLFDADELSISAMSEPVPMAKDCSTF
jgi:hypothetical protein